MRIAVWHNLPSGGAKRALWYHVRGLLARGHQVEAWCPDTADRGYLPLAELIREHVLPLRVPAAPLADRWLPWSVREYRQLGRKIRAMLRHSAECAAAIQAGGFDLLMANTCAFFGAPAIGRFIGLPSVLYLQEPSRRLYEAMPTLPWIALPGEDGAKAGPRRRLLADAMKVQGLRIRAGEETCNARSYRLVLANSYFSRESMIRAYGIDPEVCYLGVDTDLFRPTPAAPSDYVVAVGSLTAAKGAPLAIEAIGCLPIAKRPPLVWVANAVRDDERRRAEERASARGVRLTIKVRIPDEELVACLNQARCMLYTPRLEPFGFVPLEANACGRMVVAVAEGGVRETIRDGVNGVLVPSARPERIAEALGRVLGDPDTTSEATRRRVRESVESQWSLEGATGRLESFLAAACEGR